LVLDGNTPQAIIDADGGGIVLELVEHILSGTPA